MAMVARLARLNGAWYRGFHDGLVLVVVGEECKQGHASGACLLAFGSCDEAVSKPGLARWNRPSPKGLCGGLVHELGDLIDHWQDLVGAF
jgi:hypothetical protein